MVVLEPRLGSSSAPSSSSLPSGSASMPSKLYPVLPAPHLSDRPGAGLAAVVHRDF